MMRIDASKLNVTLRGRGSSLAEVTLGGVGVALVSRDTGLCCRNSFVFDRGGIVESAPRICFFRMLPGRAPSLFVNDQTFRPTQDVMQTRPS
ncbi:hypothetical protein BST61_g1647 [Cercospora zeina]